MQITLLFPKDTPMPVVGGIEQKVGPAWAQVAGKRWTRRRSGQVEATYDLDTLRLCIGMLEVSKRLRSVRMLG